MSDDWNLMTYDMMNRRYLKTTHHAGSAVIKDVVDYYHFNGVTDRKKLGVAKPFMRGINNKPVKILVSPFTRNISPSPTLPLKNVPVKAVLDAMFTQQKVQQVKNPVPQDPWTFNQAQYVLTSWASY